MSDGPTAAALSHGPYSHFSNRERKHIVMLQKRALWLVRRIEQLDQGWDKQELAALQWALGRLANTKEEAHSV